MSQTCRSDEYSSLHEQLTGAANIRHKTKVEQLQGDEYSTMSKVGLTNIRHEPAAYLVVMDKPGTRGPSGHFYTKLNKTGALRIQRSVYLSIDEGSAKEISDLGRRYGFSTRIFQIAEEIIDEDSSF